jgi:hypothetical protein
MKKLAHLNILIGAALVVTVFCFQLTGNEVLFLLIPLILLLYFGFILASLISVFITWHKYKSRSFRPFIILLVTFPLMILSGFIGHQIGKYSKPIDTKSYFSEERKEELTGIAEELLQVQNANSEQLIREKLKKHRLRISYVDRDANIVEFGYYQLRTWYRYIYTQTELPESYSTKPIITKCDILYWGELVTIIKTGNDLSKHSRKSTSHSTEIVYPFLVANLEKGFVDKLSGLPSIEDLDSFMSKNKDLPVMEALDKRQTDYETVVARKLSEKEKFEVIEVFNKHCRLSSKLVENENITWRDSDSDWRPGEKNLVFCECLSLSPSFQVNKHLERLISDGIISIIDEAGHLHVKSDLSEKEKLE